MVPLREKIFVGDAPGQSIVISTDQGESVIPLKVAAILSVSPTSTARLPDQIFPF
jgi:hypothetical protein